MADDPYEFDEDPEERDAEALEAAIEECRQEIDGHCDLAGTQYCEWQCPFRHFDP